MRLLRNKDTAAMFLIFEGIVYTMIINLYNPFIQMFAKRMGGNDLHTALLNAVPPLVAIFVLIPCGILIEKINRKKQTVLVLLSVMSVFYAAIAFVPSIPHGAKVLAYVFLIGLMNFPGSLYLTTWQSFFADNFSGSYANRLYTVRSKYSTFFGLVTVLVTGLLLTKIPRTDGERLLLYQAFYGMCFVLTLAQLFFFSRVKGNAGKNIEKASMFGRESLAGVIKNKRFIIFCLCGLAFHFTWQMAWPLFFIYNTDYAHLNEFQIGMINVVSGLAQFLSFSVWNRLIEKKGSNMVLILGTAGIAMLPLFYATMLDYTAVLIVNTISGIALAGFNLSLFLSLLDTLPKDKKTVYISVFNTITNITGFIAPLIGVWIYSMTSIYIAMGIAGILRLTASSMYFFRWRRERKNNLNSGSETTDSLAG